jgi:hypothetical protein
MKEYTVRVLEDGAKYWYLNDELHREDGPAVEWANGTKAWYLNHRLHREDGPAIERATGRKEWWLNGQEVTEEEHKRRTTKVTMDDALAAADGVILREQAARIKELEERISWDASAPFFFTLPSLSLDAPLNAQAERIAELEERISWLETTLDTVDAALSKWRHE